MAKSNIFIGKKGSCASCHSQQGTKKKGSRSDLALCVCVGENKNVDMNGHGHGCIVEVELVQELCSSCLVEGAFNCFKGSGSLFEVSPVERKNTFPE